MSRVERIHGQADRPGYYHIERRGLRSLLICLPRSQSGSEAGQRRLRGHRERLVGRLDLASHPGYAASSCRLGLLGSPDQTFPTASSAACHHPNFQFKAGFCAVRMAEACSRIGPPAEFFGQRSAKGGKRLGQVN